jgi:hypothetical protein
MALAGAAKSKCGAMLTATENRHCTIRSTTHVRLWPWDRNMPRDPHKPPYSAVLYLVMLHTKQQPRPMEGISLAKLMSKGNHPEMLNPVSLV